MKYDAVFWDIDGTMYDNSSDIPEDEKDILSKWEKLEVIPNRKLNFWIPYKGLAELMEKIPRERQGVISNGYDQLQKDKLFLFGLDAYINPQLIFTSYGEAERVLDLPDHPLMNGFSKQSRDADVHNMTLETQKPNRFMFERALEVGGFSANNCVMIGDDWKDVQGAQEVGMDTIYIAGLNSDRHYDPIGEGHLKPNHTVEKGDTIALTRLLI